MFGLDLVCMAHVSDNLFDSYLQEYMWKKEHKDNILGNIFCGYHFITARKVSTAISSLNELPDITGKNRTGVKRESRTLPRRILAFSTSFDKSTTSNSIYHLDKYYLSHKSPHLLG